MHWLLVIGGAIAVAHLRVEAALVVQMCVEALHEIEKRTGMLRASTHCAAETDKYLSPAAGSLNAVAVPKTGIKPARWRYTRCANSFSVIAIVLASVVSLSAAAPRLILVRGALLERPVLIEDWEDNARIIAAINSPVVAEVEALASRPFYEFALFWGSEWVQHMNEGRPVAGLKPEQANQRGRLYPAVGAAPALFMFADEPGPMQRGTRIMGLVRSVEQEGLDVFAKYGLRVRMN